MYFQNADAAIIVYDITFKESFEAAKNWVKELRENTSVQGQDTRSSHSQNSGTTLQQR